MLPLSIQALAASALLLATTTFAAPLQHTRDDHFNDGFGDVPNDMFSFIMTPEFKTISIYAAYHDKSYLTSTPYYQYTMPCNDENDWNSIKPDWLPWTMVVHGGNLCTDNFFTLDKYAFDNLWIKYSNQYIDAPSDTRCGPAGGSRRCILPLRPEAH